MNRPPYGFVSLRIEDEASRTLIVEVELSWEQWGKLVTGRTAVNGLPLVLMADRAGLKYEHKTEKVPLAKCAYADRQATAERAVAPFEVDGWAGHYRDWLNHHTHKDGFAA